MDEMKEQVPPESLATSGSSVSVQQHRRVLLENRVVAEMTSLTVSRHEYSELIRSLLDAIEQVVESPFLCLSIQEEDRPGHYARVRDGVDMWWAEEIGRQVAETLDRRLPHRAAAGMQPSVRHTSGPIAWMAIFPAETRSGRTGALVLASPETVQVSPAVEALMVRLVRHALLVVDHALLLQQIDDLESSDRLTGLANNRRLLEIIEYEMRRHRQRSTILAMVVLDVEGLDRINRSYGRQYGNHILQKLAGLLERTVRPIDTVARYGWDEFAVVLPEMNEEEGHVLAERIQEDLLGVEFAGGTVGLSVGVAQVKPVEVLSAEEFVRRAEGALHQTKRSSRGQTALWEAGARRTAP